MLITLYCKRISFNTMVRLHNRKGKKKFYRDCRWQLGAEISIQIITICLTCDQIYFGIWHPISSKMWTLMQRFLKWRKKNELKDVGEWQNPGRTESRAVFTIIINSFSMCLWLSPSICSLHLFIAYRAKMMFCVSPLCITCVLLNAVLINWLTFSLENTHTKTLDIRAALSSGVSTGILLFLSYSFLKQI